MTLKEIAIELLEKYEASENVAICEYSTNINKDMDLLEKEVKKYRRMIENADRKTEPTISKMEQVDKDINVRSKDCETCKHYKLACELFSEICKYEPTNQTETQNSNLTFKTLEYCDICDHKGCEECIANALDEHCMPSQFKKQIEDECAKEYEELGLKELKELIEADRKDENCSENPNNCEDEPQYEMGMGTLKCDNCSEYGSFKCTKCDGEMYFKRLEPKDEPQTVLEAVLDRQTDEDRRKMAESVRKAIKDEPQTDCDHKCIQTEIGCEKLDCPWK